MKSRAPLCPGPPAVQWGPSAFDMPANAIDSHAHVIGAEADYPWMPDASYTAPPAPAVAYLKMLDEVGTRYGVLVQVSGHGQDNRLLLETLRANPTRLRGVVVPTLGLGDSEYQAMSDAGTVGVRMNLLHRGGGMNFAQLAEYEALALDWGWHMQFLLDPQRLVELAPQLRKLKATVVLDHMGHQSTAAGWASSAFQQVLGLVRDGAWVKLSGAYRVSAEEPPYRDTICYAQSLIEASPERCVWGSDWPHVATWTTMPTVGKVLDTLALWAPEPAIRDAILTTNAHRLYGFR